MGEPKPPQSPSVIEGNERLKIKLLLADDRGDVRETIVLSLEDEGYEITEVKDGEEILEMLESGEYTAVLSDNNMTRMDGIEALRRIRQNPKFKNLPFFLMTGMPDNALEEEVKSLGGGFFSKPFDVFELRPAIEAAIENSSK